MTVITQLLTFGSSPVQFTTTTALGRKIQAEPLSSNTHTCYVGTSAVTNDGSGTGVISELAKPGQAAQQSPNHFCQSTGILNAVDPTAFYFHGTSGEKIKVTLFIN